MWSSCITHCTHGSHLENVHVGCAAGAGQQVGDVAVHVCLQHEPGHLPARGGLWATGAPHAYGDGARARVAPAAGTAGPALTRSRWRGLGWAAQPPPPLSPGRWAAGDHACAPPPLLSAHPLAVAAHVGSQRCIPAGVPSRQRAHSRLATPQRRRQRVDGRRCCRRDVGACSEGLVQDGGQPDADGVPGEAAILAAQGRWQGMRRCGAGAVLAHVRGFQGRHGGAVRHGVCALQRRGQAGRGRFWLAPGVRHPQNASPRRASHSSDATST
jgi:hypothetical protein